MKFQSVNCHLGPWHPLCEPRKDNPQHLCVSYELKTAKTNTDIGWNICVARVSHKKQQSTWTRQRCPRHHCGITTGSACHLTVTEEGATMQWNHCLWADSARGDDQQWETGHGGGARVMCSLWGSSRVTTVKQIGHRCEHVDFFSRLCKRKCADPASHVQI